MPQQASHPVLASSESLRQSRIANYEFFILDVAAEDGRIQMAAQLGKTNTVVQTDFSSAIGFAKTDEQVMLAIVRSAYPQLEEIFRQLGVANHELQSMNPNEHPDPDALAIEKETVVREAIDKLSRDLGEESFRKLDAFVSRGGLLAPVTPKTSVSNSNPCPTFPTKGVVRFTKGYGYRELFEQIGSTNDYNLRQASENDKHPILLPSVINPSEDEREAIISIALDANRQIREIERQYLTTAHEFYQKNYELYGSKANSMPDPPEIAAIFPKRLPILEDSISRIRQLLGDETFRALDRYVFSSDEHGHFELISDGNGRFIEMAVRPCSFASDKPKGDAASAQTTEARHD